MVHHYVQFLFIYLLETHKYFYITIFPGLFSFRDESCVCCAMLCILLLFSMCMTIHLGLLLFPLCTHSSFPYCFHCLFMPLCLFFLFCIYHSFSFIQTNPVVLVQQLTLNDISHCQTSLEIQHWMLLRCVVLILAQRYWSVTAKNCRTKGDGGMTENTQNPAERFLQTHERRPVSTGHYNVLSFNWL